MTSASARVPARQQSIRASNLALAYRLVLDAPTPLSRAALAAATGMTRATAGALADALLAAGLVQEVAPPPASTAGRPATGLVPASAGWVGLGLEVNVDHLAACVVDLTGAVRRQVTVDGDQRGREPGPVLADLAALAHRVADDLAAPDAPETGPGDALRIAQVAVAVPGLVRSDGGRVLRAPNLDWQDVDVVEELTPRLPEAPARPTVGNEADYAALAELDADRELRDFLYVSGEIGVGAGVVFDRRPFTGSRGWAGEIGHVTVEPGGDACRCGARGCLETVAGLDALRSPDPDASERAGSGLGRAIAAAVNLYDLDTVVLGGAYAQRPDLEELVRAALAEHVVSASWAPVAVRRSRLGGTAAAIGAAASVVHRIHADPAAWEARD
ncbi:ROK family protein [Streptacidiphilus neutrinimicus]|uniref:ROK family protein n=1 Tax=Streptacidiphilus neutrinimicus TaxID=105420 RepID=UPI00069366A8|nr:ROK family protein [Streptacidiphilus neutrinimicus]